MVFKAELSMSLLSYEKRFTLTITSDFDPTSSRRLVSLLPPNDCSILELRIDQELSQSHGRGASVLR